MKSCGSCLSVSLISLSISIHVVTNGKITFFGQVIVDCVYVPHLLYAVIAHYLSTPKLYSIEHLFYLLIIKVIHFVKKNHKITKVLSKNKSHP